MASALWIQNAPVVVRDPRELFAMVTDHPAIIASACVLTGRAANDSSIPAGRNTYVFQREFAVVPRDGRIIGSDRATTCHMLIATSQTRTFCAHLDGFPGQAAALLAALRDAFPNDA